MWQDIIGHREIRETLGRILASDKVGHAYLFLGPKGVGKASLAEAFALGVVSSSANLPHPDIVIFQSDTQSVLIEQMRALKNQALLTPLVSKRKVFIVERAEKLTVQAANSLLQILEEPPPSVVIILLANTPNILPTLISRCHVLRFGVLSLEHTIEVLQHALRLDQSTLTVERAARLSLGSPGEALRLLADDARLMKTMRSWAVPYMELGLEDKLKWLVNLEKESEALYDYVYFLTVWLRDLYCCKLGLVNYLAWADGAELERQSMRLEFSVIQDKLDALHGLLVQWGPGISKRMVLDQLLITGK